MSSPISPAKSCASGQTSPCRCRGFISSGTRAPMRQARYCYNGPAFRFQPKGASGTHPREFRQAGIECFGVADRDSADAEVVLLVADAVRSAGLKQFRFRFGDIALFYALLDALSLPERWRLKLRHYFWRPPAFHALLVAPRQGRTPRTATARSPRLPPRSPIRIRPAPRSWSPIISSRSACLSSGNRTLGEIAERLLDHAADLRAEPLPREVATVIDYYLAVEASPREAIDRIAMIAKGAGIDLGPALYVLVPPLRPAAGARHRRRRRELRHRVRPRPRILFGPRVPDRSCRRQDEPDCRRRPL